jgi:hypothetical protein
MSHIDDRFTIEDRNDIPRAMTQARLILIATLVVSALLRIAAQDWSQWRGPARTGATAAFKAPATWPDRPKQVWKVQAGIGHASPIVSANRVYLFSRVGEQEALTAFAANVRRAVPDEFGGHQSRQGSQIDARVR